MVGTHADASDGEASVSADAVAGQGGDVSGTVLPGHLPTCFGCGADNPAGIRLEVRQVGDEIRADVTFDERHTGGPGLAHGGAIATACDDFLGYAVYLIGAPAVTRVLTIDYLAPVRLHDTHHISARIDQEVGRVVHMSATGHSSHGSPSFMAKGVMVKVPLEHFTEFDVPDAQLEAMRDQLEDLGRG